VIPRPACSCHGWAACVHQATPWGRPDPDGRDESRGWVWHCPLSTCEGYPAPLVVLHEWVLADLAAEQRNNANRLLAAVRKASSAGVSWREIGKALGAEHTTVFRQAMAGSPIVIVHPFQDPQVRRRDGSR
jgi:hypothetical protein